MRLFVFELEVRTGQTDRRTDRRTSITRNAAYWNDRIKINDELFEIMQQQHRRVISPDFTTPSWCRRLIFMNFQSGAVGPVVPAVDLCENIVYDCTFIGGTGTGQGRCPSYLGFTPRHGLSLKFQ